MTNLPPEILNIVRMLASCGECMGDGFSSRSALDGAANAVDAEIDGCSACLTIIIRAVAEMERDGLIK